MEPHYNQQLEAPPPTSLAAMRLTIGILQLVLGPRFKPKSKMFPACFKGVQICQSLRAVESQGKSWRHTGL